MDEPLGLIAGEGIFPLLVAGGAKAAGRRVVCAGLGGCVWPEVRGECDSFKEVGVLRVGQWVRYLKSHGVREAIMVGRVRKEEMYSRWRYFQYIPDIRTLRVWFTRLRHDKRDHAILLAVCDELAAEGIKLIDSTQYSKSHLAMAGVMTHRQPSERQLADIFFGWQLCRTVSSLDIGQSIAVIDKDVIAVEAVEGTDAMIERAGKHCKSGGWTLIKVANKGQDMRMDVPTVGLTTIQKLKEAKAGCLVLEVGKTILLEKEKVLELADRLGIVVVGWPAES